MKTTVDIPDSFYSEARKIAAGEKSSVKALIEEGLRKVIEERKQRKHFKLRKATFKGNGLQAELAGASWDKIREKVYEGRGG
jgi:predicted DNA-binding ribbon-helix-helix protein